MTGAPHCGRVPPHAILLFVLLTLCASGCGKDGDGGSDSVSAGLERARSAMELARESAALADAPEYAPGVWKQAVAYQDKAEDLEASGSSKAASRYKMAASRFDKATRLAGRNRKTHDVAVAAREQYLHMREQATELDIEASHPDSWSRAEQHYGSGQELLGDSRTFKRARKQFVFAYNELEHAVRRSRDAATARSLAVELRADVQALRAQAEAAGAVEQARVYFEQGREAEREGDGYYDEGLYVRARDAFRVARQSYAAALDKIRLGAVASTGPQEAVPLPERNPDDIWDDEAPGVGEIELPPADPGEHLASELHRLFHCVPEYDDRVIELDYSSGVNLEHDVTVDPRCRVTGPMNKRHLIFEGIAGVGRFARGTGDEDLEEEDDDAWLDYSFAGNTRGLMLLDCRFEDGVQIEFDVAYQLIVADNPHFQVLLNADAKARSYYATDWGSWLVDQEYKRPQRRSHTQHKDFPKRPPQLWVDKTRPHHWKIHYKKDGDRDGRLRIWVDEKLTFDRKTNKYTDGFVGFIWEDVKFVVSNLRVKGRLDHEWARAALQERGLEPDEPDDADPDDFDF